MRYRFRTVTVLVLFTLIAGPVIAQDETEEETDEEGRVTISWGQEEEESTGGAAALLDNLPGRGNGQENQQTASSLDLPPYEFSVGAAFGYWGETADETTPATEELDVALPVAITGKAFYTLNSPLIGDEFREGRGLQVGGMLQLATEGSASAIYAVVALRRSGRVAAYQYGLGTPFDGGTALSAGVQYQNGLVLDYAFIVGPDDSFLSTLFGVGWTF